jgi:acetyl esterase/lipase
MSSEALHEFTRYMRGLQGSKAGLVRDATLMCVGRGFSGAYALQRRVSKSPAPHPLFRILAAQTGDPYDVWPLDDLPSLRLKSEEMLDFLPRHVKGHVVTHHMGTDQGTTVLEVVPQNVSDETAVIYLHGGGFVMGSASSVLPEADAIASGLGRSVFVMDYPLAPEKRLNVTAQAVDEVLHWIATRRSVFQLVGESAGGYLGIRSLLRDPSLNASCNAAVLFYPLLDLQVDSDSVKRFSSGFMLSRRILEWFVACAVPEGEAAESWCLRHETSSLRAKVLVIVGEYDPLLDDWKAISGHTSQLSVQVAPGLMHGFMQMRGILPEREKWLEAGVEYLR